MIDQPQNQQSRVKSGLAARKRRLMVLGAGLVMAAAVSAAAWYVNTPRVPASDPEFERGRYLVEAVMACDSCHTPRGANGLDFSRRFSGGSEVWDTPSFKVRGSNITQDAQTGIGKWNDEQLARLLTDGIRPDGTRVAAQMPWRQYRVLTARDLDAVVRFVRSVRPVVNRVEPPVYKRDDYSGPPPVSRTPDRGTGGDGAIARGAYLGSLAYCMACHARRPDGIVDQASWEGKGGFRMIGTFGEVVVPNITSDPVRGIGRWSDAELHRALFEGVGRDGRHFELPMARQVFYRGMSAEDQAAIILWLRSLPAG